MPQVIDKSGKTVRETDVPEAFAGSERNLQEFLSRHLVTKPHLRDLIAESPAQ